MTTGYLVLTQFGQDGGKGWESIEALVASANIQSPSSYYRQFWQNRGVVVQGNWGWSNSVNQTNYSSDRGEGAGTFNNAIGGGGTGQNFDEYKWPSIFLVTGTYKVTIVSHQHSDMAIMEILFGNQSIGMNDMYSPIAVFNVVVTNTFSISSPTTADFRIRANGKNILSTSYELDFSRLELEKIA